MNDEMLVNNGGEDTFESVLGLLILDGAGSVIGLLGTFVILIAGVRLFRSTNVPGASYIYYSMVLTAIGFTLPFVSYFIYGEDGSFVFDTVVNIYVGLAYLLGAYGFWLLTSYVISSSANK